MKVLTPKTIINYAVRHRNGEVSFKDILLSEDFDLRIKISGESWKGEEIDYRFAEFVLALQRDVIGAVNMATGRDFPIRYLHELDDDLVIKFSVRNGSLEIVAKLSDFFVTIINKLPDENSMLTICFLAVIFAGGYFWSSKLEEQTKVAYKEIDEETKRVAIDALHKAVVCANNNAKSMASLIRKMHRDDMISIGKFIRSNKMIAYDDTIAKDEAQLMLQHSGSSAHHMAISRQEADEKFRDRTFFIDGQYEVRWYSQQADRASICTCGICFEASTITLNDRGKTLLHGRVVAPVREDARDPIDLNVVARVYSGNVDHAYIVGVGGKRKGSININRLIDMQQYKDRGMPKL